MALPDELWLAEEAFRESVAREWVAQRLFWERRLRSVTEQAEEAGQAEAAHGHLRRAS